MADGAVDALADQWIERRTQGQGQAMAVGEIGQDHRHDGVDRPGMQAPVEEGDLHRLARGGNGAAFAGGGRDEVHHRLGDAEEHQADAHAGGKQHGEPGQAAVVGFAMIGAELDIAVAAQGDQHHHQQDDRHREDVQPAEVGDDPGLHLAEQSLCVRREDDAVQYQREDQYRRAVEDRRIDGGRGRLVGLHAALLDCLLGSGRLWRRGAI